MPVIKRYSNRKLYDTEARQYITLDEIGEMIQQGQEIKVVDHGSGADLTALTLAQIIFEQEKKIGGMLPEAILTRLIRFGGDQISNIRGAARSILDPAQAVEDEIQRRLAYWIKDGTLSDLEGKKIKEKLLDKRFHRPDFPDGELDAPESDEPQMKKLLEQLEDHVAKMEKDLDDLLKKKQG